VGLLRKSIGLSLAVLGLMSCVNSETEKKVGTKYIDIPASADDAGEIESGAFIAFEKKEVLAGDIVQGEVTTHEFAFVNEGSEPLVISSVKGSCGCTVPRTYPRQPVAPGEGGIIEVQFDSAGKSGEQVMTVSVVTNSIPNLTQLLIRAQILVPDNMQTNN